MVDNPPPPSPPTPPPPVAAPTPEPPPEPASAHGRGQGAHPAPRGATPPRTGADAPPPLGPVDAAAAPPSADNSANARYKDTAGTSTSPAAAASRGRRRRRPTSRASSTTTAAGIKNCYQRALLRDSSLTHGKISVKVNIGISGRVKHTAIDGPPQFRALEPCIKEIVGRWAFPPAGDEYGTEFVYVFQGNE